MIKYIIFFILYGFCSFAAVIEDFNSIKKYVSLVDGRRVLLYREFLKDGELRFLGTDVSSLKTYLVENIDIKNDEEGFEETRLFKALQKPPIRSLQIKSGYFLTIDLCSKPKNASKKFEKNLFEFLVNLANENNSPIPVGIAISGNWIKEERDNFNYIKNLEREKKLDIIWINHSTSHPANNGKFLTAKNVDFEKEVLELEKILLKNDEVPTVFFRFPGLVFNKLTQEKLSALSLIPLDANAWLSKGEKITNGSIILVHGNGNENRGVKRLMKYMKNNKRDFVSIYHD
jgi:hypothetical protein